MASQPHCACASLQTAPEKVALTLPPSTSEEPLAHLVKLLRGEKQTGDGRQGITLAHPPEQGVVS